MKELTKKVKLLEPIDVNNITIKRDHYFPNAYIIDLPLDAQPDHVWQDIFEREWKLSRQLWDRKLFVIGKELRLVTTVNEIEDKLDWVKQVIEKTNKSIDDYNRKVAARATQMEEQDRQAVREQEKSSVELIKDVLRRRRGAY